jgi:hypothetical protein
LLIAGEHDKNAPPAVMKKMADAIPRSSYLQMRGIGHLQNLEAPDDFDALVLNFLALPAPQLALTYARRPALVERLPARGPGATPNPTPTCSARSSIIRSAPRCPGTGIRIVSARGRRWTR